MFFIIEKEYDREKAEKYAHKWVYNRNPKFYNFDKIGGDCTNFISQCMYAGCGVMNYSRNGWYYISINNRAPAWTGVEFLYNFLVNNKGAGPYGKQIEPEQSEIGDIAQLSFDGNKFTHSLFIVDTSDKDILVATHTYDADYKKISQYNFVKIRFIKIEGVRV